MSSKFSLDENAKVSLIMSKPERSSNLELLRIVAMLFIVLYHFIYHVLIKRDPGNEILRSIEIVLHIGVVLFVLISGYWGIRPSLRGFFRFYLQCVFYSIAILVVTSAIGVDFINFKETAKAFLAVSHSDLWFIRTYACLYLFSPILNVFLEKAGESLKILMILSLGVLSFYFGLFSRLPDLADGKNVINFTLIYCIGNYLKNNIDQQVINRRKNHILLIYLAFNMIIFSLMIFGNEFHSVPSILFRIMYPYNSPGIIVNATIFFLIFTTLEIRSKQINWFASSILAVYLIHENPRVGRFLYKYIAHLQNTTTHLLILTALLILIACCILTLAVLIDKAAKPLLFWIEKKVFGLNVVSSLESKMKTVLLDFD